MNFGLCVIKLVTKYINLIMSIPISRISRKGLPKFYGGDRTPISKYFWPISDIMIDILYGVGDVIYDVEYSPLENPILSVQNHTNQSAKK
jgi:hypothetical protein